MINAENRITKKAKTFMISLLMILPLLIFFRTLLIFLRFLSLIVFMNIVHIVIENPALCRFSHVVFFIIFFMQNFIIFVFIFIVARIVFIIVIMRRLSQIFITAEFR